MDDKFTSSNMNPNLINDPKASNAAVPMGYTQQNPQVDQNQLLLYLKTMEEKREKKNCKRK